MLKGVLRGDDARRAVDAGAAGIWVSNHGGRQLDRAVLTALALGARGVFVARPALWGLATAGADGVRDVLTALTDELVHVAALAGVPDVRAVARDLVTPA